MDGRKRTRKSCVKKAVTSVSNNTVVAARDCGAKWGSTMDNLCHAQSEPRTVKKICHSASASRSDTEEHSKIESTELKRNGDGKRCHDDEFVGQGADAVRPTRKKRHSNTNNSEPLKSSGKRIKLLQKKKRGPDKVTDNLEQASNSRIQKKLYEGRLRVAVTDLSDHLFQSETVQKKQCDTLVKVNKAFKNEVMDLKPAKIDAVPMHISTGRKYVGAHVSIAGGLWNSVLSTLEINGKAFGLFLKSQRTWHSKPLADEDADLFKSTLKESGIDPWKVVPHGSYLLNCGSSDDEVLRKSREALVDELQRCEKLGLPVYNFHPGSSKGASTRMECVEKIAETINYVHEKTTNVITVIENMSCQGNTIGGRFAELKQIIDRVSDRSRIGVCLDTCHAFAAGYNIRCYEGYEQMKAEFTELIGRQFLKAVHLNDSKGQLGCHLDRHENIGKGKLGLETFRRIMNDPFFDDVPMILETPEGDYKREINTLYKMLDAH